jgi:adenylyl-sulfate kinase
VPFTVWLTGLSGAGKSTLGGGLAEHLRLVGRRGFLMDGDVVRLGLCSGLGFSREDRRENIRRVAEASRLLNDAGVTVIAALISPYAADRKMAREIIGPDRFHEVYLSSPLAVCEARDVKGLYAKARRGMIPEFTGLSSPYEPPENPKLALDTSVLTEAEALSLLVQTFGEYLS